MSVPADQGERDRASVVKGVGGILEERFGKERKKRTGISIYTQLRAAEARPGGQ